MFATALSQQVDDDGDHATGQPTDPLARRSPGRGLFPTGLRTRPPSPVWSAYPGALNVPSWVPVRVTGVETGQFWAIAGVVVGVLGLIGAFYQVRAFRLEHPRRRLEYTVTSKRLVEHDARAKLKMTVDGDEISDPYLVEFRLLSNSRSDIPSTSFDAETP